MAPDVSSPLCEVCDGSMEQIFHVADMEMGLRPMDICEVCADSYLFLKKELQQEGTPLPQGRRLRQAILAKRGYGEALIIVKETSKAVNESIQGNPVGLFQELNKAMKLFRDADAPYGCQAVLGNMGTVMTLLELYKVALSIHEAEERICRELGAQTDLAMCLYNQGMLHFRMGNPDKAKTSLRDCINILEREGGGGENQQMAQSLLSDPSTVETAQFYFKGVLSK